MRLPTNDAIVTSKKSECEQYVGFSRRQDRIILGILSQWPANLHTVLGIIGCSTPTEAQASYESRRQQVKTRLP